MKLLESLLWLGRCIAGIKNESQQQLQQQRYLLRNGMEATAEIMEAYLFEKRVGNFLPIRLWLKLKRPDGTFIYTHTSTLANQRDIPVKGQIIRIKYLPQNLSTILIL